MAKFKRMLSLSHSLADEVRKLRPTEGVEGSRDCLRTLVLRQSYALAFAVIKDFIFFVRLLEKT